MTWFPLAFLSLVLLLAAPCGLMAKPKPQPSYSQVSSRDSGTSLACLTVYWKSEGGRWASSGLSATGLPLRSGHCAVDPKVIPFGSVVTIPNIGTFLAVDTGKAVIARRAALRAGRTPEEKHALVVDLFFSSRESAEQFASRGPKFATITWWPPWCSNSQAEQARKLFRPEDWARLQSLGTL